MVEPLKTTDKQRGCYIGGICVLVLSLGFVGLSFYCMFSEPFSAQTMGRVHIGMSEDEVRKVLGVPSVVDEDGDWRYRRPLMWNAVCVEFDENRKCVSIVVIR